jgi:hypothetical protein
MASEEKTKEVVMSTDSTPSITISSSFPRPKELPSSKYLRVIVKAQPSGDTKHLGSGSEPGSWGGPVSTGDTFYLPMVVFGYKVELKIPYEVMNKSGYLMNQIKGPWKNKSVVEIPLKNPRGVNAFADACVAGLALKPVYNGLINGYNQFNMYSAASMLQLRDLQEFCEIYIGSHLTTERFLAAMKHGVRYKRTNMLVQCYRWFKVNGAVAKEVAKEEEAEEMATDKAMANAAGLIPPKRLKYDAATKTVFTETRNADLSVFEPIIVEEHKKKTRYFIPPDDMPITTEEENSDDNSNSNVIKDNIEKALNAKGFPGLTRCYVKRKHEMGENKDETHYVVHDEKSGNVLIAACSKDGRSFILSNNETIYEIGSDSYLGMVKPNFTGTTFKCLDYGIDPSIFPGDGLAHSKAVEHASIVYVTNVLGRVPNAMTVVIPKINSTQSELSDEEKQNNITEKPSDKEKKESKTSNSSEYVPAHHKASMTEKLAKYYNKKDDRVIVLKTRKPIWSDEADAWTMDFNGRVKLASKKNFQLVDINNDKEKTLMNFGKVTKQHFSLDYCKPMTLIQCFAVALTSFSDKMMVT